MAQTAGPSVASPRALATGAGAGAGAGVATGSGRTRSRREQARDATTREIRTTARGLLVTQGPDALTLRAIARAMGISAPALYRYFDSHEAIVAALCSDVLAEITETLEQARDSASAEPPVRRLGVTCRAFRGWALAHPREFQLIFASPAEGPPRGHDQVDDKVSFGAVFLGLFVEIWQDHPFAVHSEAELPAGLLAQLRTFSAYVDGVLPLGALAAYLAGWVRLYGAVTVEVFGHLGFALTDAEPMFEVMLADMARQLSTPA